MEEQDVYYKMDTAAVSSDDSCDSEMKSMKIELSEFGLDEENLSKQEMSDLLKALKNSKSTVKEDDLIRQKVEDTDGGSPKKFMKRRYLNVRDRRMPWSLLPSTITQAEKARALAVYIKLMSVNNYWQARQSPNFMSWPPPIQIVEESTRVQPIRSTRSGRCVPVYTGFDDDSSDLDFIVAKPKKRKVSNSDQNNEGGATNKTLSLKRKSSKDENTKPVKEPKMTPEINKSESTNPGHNARLIFTVVED